MRSRNWHKIALYALALAFVGYLIVVPVAGMIYQKVYPPKSIQYVEDMTLAEEVRLRSMEACTAFTFFALGAAIGSFLNVVAYRAPRGESVTFKRSHCPSCGKPILGRDNVPIVGWLLLKGRCRACWAPISPRYLTVELVMAGLFLLLYLAELISGGANIPLRRPNHYHGVVWIIFYTKWDLVGLYAFHCFALSVLLTWTLIDIDRQRIPAWLKWLVVALLAIPPAIWPDLLPVPWAPSGLLGVDWPERLLSATTCAVGGLVGLVLGWLVSRVLGKRSSEAAEAENPDETPAPPHGHVVSASLIVGLSLGWQAVVGVWVIALALRPILSWAARRLGFVGLPTALILLVAYVIQLLGWRWSTTKWWPSCYTSLALWAVYGLVLGALCLLNRAVPTSGRSRQDPLPEPTEPVLEIGSVDA